MYRFISITVILVLALSTGASADGTNVEETVGGVVVTAGSSGSLTTTSHPGRPGTGPTIYCGWFRFTGGFGSEVFDLVGDPVSPIVGHVYALNCWTDDRDDPYPGYPIIRQYHGRPEIPGELCRPRKQHGSRSLTSISSFQRLNCRHPMNKSWASRLGSQLRVNFGTTRSRPTPARCGPPFGHHCAMSPGILATGARRVCRQDVSKLWDSTTNQPQTSRCIYTYTNSSGSPFDLTATVR